MRLSSCVVVFLATITVCSSQTVMEHVELLDQRLATPRALIEQGDFYFTAHDGGILAFISRDFSQSGVVRTLDSFYIVDVFRHGGDVFASSMDGDLFYMRSIENWIHLGQYDCHPYMDAQGAMFVTLDARLVTIAGGSQQWESVDIGEVPVDTQQIRALAVRGDTVLYSNGQDSLLRIVSLDGMVDLSVPLTDRVSQFYPLSDGSIAMELGYRVTHVVQPASLRFPIVSGVFFGTSSIFLSNGRSVVVDGVAGVIGRRDIFGQDPFDAVYLLTGTDSIRRVGELDSLFDRSFVCGRSDSTWLLATTSYIGSVTNSGNLSDHYMFGDSTVQPGGGISFSLDHRPYGTGLVRVGDSRNPAILPNSVNEGMLEALDIQATTGQVLRSYKQYADGRQIAFLDRKCYAGKLGDTWQEQYETKGTIDWDEVQYLDYGVVACLTESRRLILSTDQGQTWRSTVIKGMITGVDGLSLHGDTVVVHSYGTIWIVPINGLVDTVDPVSTSIQAGSYNRLLGLRSGKVVYVSGRSSSDASFNPATLTHFVFFEWDPVSGTTDSTTVELRSPVTAWLLQMAVKGDTVLAYSGQESRMLSLTRHKIIYDSVLTFTGHRSFGRLGVTTSSLQPNGMWWLINEARNVAVAVDPSLGVNVSVEDYPKVYVYDVTPNPASTYARVTLGRFAAATEEGIQLFIADIRGNKVRDYSHLVAPFSSTYSRQNMILDIHELPVGLYFVVVKNLQGVHARKLVITN